MLLARRIALLEAAQAARLDRMSEAELMAVLDRTCGEGAGAFFSAYMDALPLEQLEALAAGDLAQSTLAREAFEAWQGGA